MSCGVVIVTSSCCSVYAADMYGRYSSDKYRLSASPNCLSSLLYSAIDSGCGVYDGALKNCSVACGVIGSAVLRYNKHIYP